MTQDQINLDLASKALYPLLQLWMDAFENCTPSLLEDVNADPYNKAFDLARLLKQREMK